ncbi:MAG: hypothetical protein C5B59_13435 [Bacteroidetes bacterium]|nr:MAG: hypothetical protein C5B59_13435 [Bacteroidota bacterium]
MGQAVGRVDKKTKEFTVPANLKTEYRVFGYEYANPSTRKMICFSSRVADVKDNFNRCPLGSYFDSEKIKYGDKIIYLGPIGAYGKMGYIASDGKKTIFYLPKSNFTVK